jgi:hypothetical protein
VAITYGNHSFCHGVSHFATDLYIVAVTYRNTIVVVVKKFGNNTVLVVINRYNNGKIVCSEKLLRQHEHIVEIAYVNKYNFRGTKHVSQQKKCS